MISAAYSELFIHYCTVYPAIDQEMNPLTLRIPLIIGYILYIFIVNLLNPDIVRLILPYIPCCLSGSLQYRLVKHT